MTHSTDLYARVTQSIIAALEAGAPPWHQPWARRTPGRFGRPLRHNGTAYRGINVLMLWEEANTCGYLSPYWLTFRQALQLHAHVRKGETGAKIVYAEPFTKSETDAEGEAVEKRGIYWKAYTVFNAEQIENLPPRYSVPVAPPQSVAERLAHAEAFFERIGAVTVHGGDRAFYHPVQDRIHLPPLEAFNDVESYYATRAHETVHWTKHPARLNRDFGAVRWGDEGYAMEELVAELGAAFLCADLHLSCEPREDHAAYLDHWLRVFKSDPRAIFSAASHAQRACDYLQGLEPETPEGGRASGLPAVPPSVPVEVPELIAAMGLRPSRATPSSDLSTLEWEDIAGELNQPRSRLLATIQFDGIPHHLEAIEVLQAEGIGPQRAVCESNDSALADYSAADGGDGPFSTVEIGGGWYALFVVPFRS